MTKINAVHWIVRHAFESPKRALGVVAAALILCALGWNRVEVELNPYDSFKRSDPHISSQLILDSNYDDGHSITFIVRNPEAELSASDYCGLAHWTQSYVQNHAEVRSVSAPFLMRRPVEKDQKLWYPKRISIDCDGDPALWPATWHQGWSELNASIWQGILVGRDARDLPIYFVFDDARDEQGNVRVDYIAEALASLRAWIQSNTPRLKIALVGASSFSYQLHEVMRKDLLVQSLIVLVFVLFFRVICGSWRASAYFLATMLITLAMLFGLMGWLGLPVNVLSNSLVLMTAIAGIEDFLFLTMQQRSRSAREGFFRLALPGFFTTLTTMLGFLSLGFSKVRLIRDFGIEAGIASVLEFLATFYVLPALLTLWGRRMEWFFPERILWKPKLFVVARRLPRFFAILLSLLPFFFVAIVSSHLNFDEDAAKSFPAHHLHTESFELLRQTRGWQTVVDVLFPPTADVLDQEEGAEMKRVDGALVALSQIDGVVHVENPYGVLRDFDQGLDDAAVKMVNRDLQGTRLWKSYFSTTGWTRARLYLRSEALSFLRPRILQMKEVCRAFNCQLGGKTLDYMAISDQVVPTLLGSFWLSLALVGVVIGGLAFYKQTGFIIPLLISAWWGPVVMLVCLWGLQIEINLVTSLFAAVIVGLTGDNAIQYIFATDGNDIKVGMRTMAGSSFLLTLILSVCGLTLVLQTPIALKTLGVLFFVAFIVNWIGDFIILSEWVAGDRD